MASMSAWFGMSPIGIVIICTPFSFNSRTASVSGSIQVLQSLAVNKTRTFGTFCREKPSRVNTSLATVCKARSMLASASPRYGISSATSRKSFCVVALSRAKTVVASVPNTEADM